MAKKKAASGTLTEEQKTAYYDAMRQRKVQAGLSLAQAIEVTAKQRETDEANGVELEIDVPEETPPA